MITLESIVESLKIQLKPNLNDDVKLYDEFIIRMIDDTRAAIIKALYVSNDLLISFYQNVRIKTQRVLFDSDDDDGYEYSIAKLPTRLMTGIRYKNIQNIGISLLPNSRVRNIEFHYCSYNEFMMYKHHIYGKDVMVICNAGDELLLRHESLNKESDVYVELIGIFETPNEVSGYEYDKTSYPVSYNVLRQLEIVTFQHLAAKLGMPVDVINNGYDETRNANIPQPKQQRKEKEEDDE